MRPCCHANPAAPIKTIADVVARLNAACNEVLAQADIKKKMLDLGITTAPGSMGGFTGFVRDQVAALSPAVKGAGVKL